MARTRPATDNDIVAAANDVAPDTIKVRLTITPDVETELLGGAAELLDLERQGLIFHEPEVDADGNDEAAGDTAAATEGSGE